MSVLENVAFGLKQRKIDDPMTKAQASLDLVELGHLALRRPAQLSGGQQQRVALARALVNRPSLLLLDEPLGALDLKLRRQMQIELKAIQMEVGLTFLHVTHDQEEAMDMADTVAVMNKGRIEQMGSPEKLYDRPKTVFVSKFLGQSNLFVGKVEEDECFFNQHQRCRQQDHRSKGSCRKAQGHNCRWCSTRKSFLPRRKTKAWCRSQPNWPG